MSKEYEIVIEKEGEIFTEWLFSEFKPTIFSAALSLKDIKPTEIISIKEKSCN